MSKFEVGDIVKIKDDLIENHLYEGQYFVEEMNKYKGKIAIIEREVEDCVYEISIDDDEFDWNDYMLESYKLTLDDIQFGDIVTLRNGERYVCSKRYMYGEKTNYCLDSVFLTECIYDEDLKFIGHIGREIRNTYCDIVKVERQGQVIYQRKEEEVEMTLSEVCEKLGYNVKIVKEKSEE